MLIRNPADCVDLPERKSSAKMRALGKAEVKAFLAATAQSKWHMFFHLMVATEALALAWKDIEPYQGHSDRQQELRMAQGRKALRLQRPEDSLEPPHRSVTLRSRAASH